MKRISVAYVEPKVTVELNLSEVKRLKDVLGAHSGSSTISALRGQGIDVHPNLTEWIRGTFAFLANLAQEMENQK